MVNIIQDTHPRIIAQETHPRIVVFGLGGAGNNAVNNMIHSTLEGVEFIAANTDIQALQKCLAPTHIQIGRSVTKGLGAGSKPEIGRQAAEEQLDEINKHLEGVNLVFITAGMGGGTGTGSAPVIAKAAQEKKILTIGIVTKPFHCEGRHRMRMAEQGIEQLQQYVDTLIVIPNQNLFTLISNKTTLGESFQMVDDILYSGVRSVSDLIVRPGEINIDFADLRTVIEKKGKALMGTGEGKGENRALQAAEAAISNPLLEQKSLQGASGILINITGGKDLKTHDVDEAVNRIQYEVDPQANIIFGANYDESYTDEIRISVIATGIDAIKPPELMVLSSETPQSPDGTISSYHRGLVKAQIPQESQNREHDQPVDPVKSEVPRSWKYDIFNAPIQPNTIHTFSKPLERQAFVRLITPDQTSPDDPTRPDDPTDLPDFLKVNK